MLAGGMAKSVMNEDISVLMISGLSINKSEASIFNEVYFITFVLMFTVILYLNILRLVRKSMDKVK